jgi:hypothetical protein
MTVPLHLGPVHPVEQALTLLLAFGPFLVLGIVVWRRRRLEARDGAGDDPGASDVRGAEDGTQRDR